MPIRAQASTATAVAAACVVMLAGCTLDVVGGDHGPQRESGSENAALWPKPASDAELLATMMAAQAGSDDAEIRRNMCAQQGSRGSWLGALGPCAATAERFPSDILAQRRLAHVAFELRLYDRAATAAAAAAAAAPGDASAQYILGRSLVETGRADDGFAAMQKAIELEPRRIDYRRDMAAAYLGGSDYNLAIQTLERAAELKPSDPEVAAMLDDARREVEERLSAYSNAVAAAPGSAAAEDELAAAYHRLGFHDSAIAHFDTALDKFRAAGGESGRDRRLLAKIYYSRGVVLKGVGRLDEALDSLALSIDTDSYFSAEAYYDMGLIRLAQGDARAAVDLLLRSVEREPKIAANRKALAEAYERAGRPGLAEHQRRVIENLP